MRSVPWNALAIVVAGGLIGLGLFLGLRPSAPRPAAPVHDLAAAQRKATAEVQAWLERQRPAFVRTCWEPSVAKAAEPARVPLSFNFSFDEHGREIGRGLNKHREAFRAVAAQCVRTFTERLEISPPCTTLAVDLTISLPN